MSASKIRIKFGSTELEYEGPETFSVESIEALLTAVQRIGNQGPTENAKKMNGEDVENENPTKLDAKTNSFSTNTIAAHLGAKTGAELVICAMVQNEIFRGKLSSRRDDIASEMKAATTYFNTNMIGNLTTTLSGLVKNKKINEVAKDTYALGANERTTAEAKLANIG